MTDERERRFRARIDLKTGQAEVTETHPVDRRTAATIPSQVRAPERAEPPHTVEPATTPLFPWARSAPVPPPQPPMDAPPQEQMQPQDDAPVLGTGATPWWSQEATLMPAVQSAVSAPTSTDTRSEIERQEDRFVERATMKLLDSLREFLGLPPVEPPVLGAEVPPLRDVVEHVAQQQQYHPAGAFASTPRSRVFHPNGAFANRDPSR